MDKFGKFRQHSRIDHSRKDHNIPWCSLFVTQKFYISIVFNFSWGHFNSQEKLKTMLMQNFWLTNKEHYGMLWYFLERSITPQATYERFFRALQTSYDWVHNSAIYTTYAWMDYLLACCSSKANWSKGYEIFRVALSVVENNEDRRVSLVINYRLVQNLRSRRVLRWRNDHTRVALTILPDQDPSKVHEATAGSSPCVGNWVGCISGKIHAASQGSSYVKKANKQRNS